MYLFLQTTVLGKSVFVDILQLWLSFFNATTKYKICVLCSNVESKTLLFLEYYSARQEG